METVVVEEIRDNVDLVGKVIAEAKCFMGFSGGLCSNCATIDNQGLVEVESFDMELEDTKVRMENIIKTITETNSH